MRYIPDLIVEEKRVLPGYFQGHRHSTMRDGKFVILISYVLSIVAFLLAVGALGHPLLTVFYGGLGCAIFPPLKQKLEATMMIRWTLPIRVVVTSIIIALLVPLQITYSNVDRELAIQRELQRQRDEAARKLAAEQEVVRKDSLAIFLNESRRLLENEKFKLVSSSLDKASSFCKEDRDYLQVMEVRQELTSKRAVANVKSGNYREAIVYLDELISKGGEDGQTLYYRGLCYAKTGAIRDAVNDLKSSMERGNAEAKKLYDKINPLKRKIIYYITRCCDGSTSNAKGRGACSHHHGVCDWNEPVYQEYREY